ncbi:MAG: hypothetical protein JWO62_1443 [Acidimicrobiaceae bacterium]|jgi:hypothetical protein|nr:hypothetical protein [Acidimicrobiaceae bacterium]
MRLDDYLATRIAEQSVHLEDLARSVNRDPWPLSPEAAALTISIGTDIARRRSGSSALIRALYRHGLPIMRFQFFESCRFALTGLVFRSEVGERSKDDCYLGAGRVVRLDVHEAHRAVAVDD